ncbi:hypothetical protein ACIHFD_46765 [Nonomuraea sp. NPDC051941]
MTEEPLTGGNNALEVVRVGDTVRRTRDVETANPRDQLPRSTVVALLPA